MQATSAANHASVLSLLEQGYPVRDIERWTGLGKSTVGRIKKEVDIGKENNLGGCPSVTTYIMSFSQCKFSRVERSFIEGWWSSPKEVL